MILLADEGHDFLDQVILVLHVARDAPARRHVAVVPALHVDRVDTIELHVAGVDTVPDRADHAAVFELVETSAGGGKDHNRQTRVAKDQQLHVAAEAAGIPLVIFAVHVGTSLSVGCDWRTCNFLIL